MWREIEGIDEGFFHIIDYSHVAEVPNQCISNNINRHILVEHNVTKNWVRCSNLKFVDLSEENEESNDGDSKGIKFDDSEEDRANENNEGFMVVEVDRPTEGCRADINGMKFRYKLKANKFSSNVKSPSKTSLVAPISFIASSSRMGGKSTNSKSRVDEDGDYKVYNWITQIQMTMTVKGC